jgi:hypothetical protein
VTLHFLNLNLDASGADDIVFSSEDAKALRGYLGDVVGDEALGADLGGIDDETAVFGEADLHRGEGYVPIRGFGA